MNAVDPRAIAAVFGHVEGIPIDEAEYVAIARARCEAAARAQLFDFGAP